MTVADFYKGLTKTELLHMYRLTQNALAVADSARKAAAERQLPAIRLEMKRRGIK